MDPFAVLGVGPDADDAAVDAAFHRLLKAVHPDRQVDRSEAERDAAAHRTREILAAREEIRCRRPSLPPVEPDDVVAADVAERLGRLSARASLDALVDQAAGQLGNRRGAPVPVDGSSVAAGLVVVVLAVAGAAFVLVGLARFF